MVNLRFLLAFVGVCSVTAFSHVSRVYPSRDISLLMAEDGASRQYSPVVTGAARFFGVAATASLLAFHVNDASAIVNPASVPGTSFSSSSSINVAADVLFLDMTLPSYGDIKDSKASVENVPSLSVKKPTASGARQMPSSKNLVQAEAGVQKPSETSPFSAVLPSMGKQSAEAKKAAKINEGSDYVF